MKFSWIVVAGAALVAVSSVIAADPALARARHKAVRHCVDRTARDPGLFGFFFNPAARPNGCAPPVYQYGRYVGQDPDPFIRLQLRRDPTTGYSPL